MSELRKDPLHDRWVIVSPKQITRIAGFEWGTGFYINPVSPEDAAQYLREV